MRTELRVWCVVVALASTLAAAGSREDAIKTYVLLKTGQAGVRSGVVVGFEGTAAIVATAAHALGGETISPSFFPSGDTRAPLPGGKCVALSPLDAQLDVVFLKCPAAACIEQLRSASLARAGALRQLEIGRALTLIGRSRTKVVVSDSNNALVDQGAPGAVFRYSSETIEEGFSGGPVLDDDWNLLGMITGTDAEGESTGLAIATDELAAFAHARSLPFQLTSAPRLRITSFSATPARVEAGASARLQWQAENAVVCVLNGGNVPPRSQKDVRPTETTTYELACTRGRTTERTTATVEVAEPAAPELTLEASETEINQGATVSLSWSSTQTSACRFADETFDRPIDGMRTVTAQASTEYRLVCRTGSGVKVSRSVFISVKVKVRIGAFRVSATRVKEGQSATLTWSSTGADRCIIDDVGTVEPNGEQNVEPTRTTTYRLRCSSEASSDSANVKVTVTPRISACCDGRGIPGCDITLWQGPFDEQGRPAPGYSCTCFGLGTGVSCYR